MTMTRHFQSITRILLATIAVAGLALIAAGPPARRRPQA